MYKTPSFNNECQKCTLCNPKSIAVAGQSQVPFDQVKLVIVSAYPGVNEIATGTSLAPSPKPAKGRAPQATAGGYMRLSLSALFDTDPNIPDEYKPFEDFVYFTNALKCSPQRGRDKLNIAAKHISTCRQLWLDRELEQMPPSVPILLAASEAVKSLLPDLSGGVYANRRKLFFIGKHPTVITFNPIEAERGAIKWLDRHEELLEDLNKHFSKYKAAPKGNILRPAFWKPAPLGSSTWHWKKDMDSIKNLVIDYINENINESYQDTASVF